MEELSASKVFAQSMRVMREGRGWSQKQLADELTKLGYPVHQTTIGKWETGARRLTLDDALVISSALSLQLVHMLSGSYLRGRDVQVKLTPKLHGFVPSTMRNWLRGQQSLPWEDAWRFRTEVSDDERTAFTKLMEERAAASRAIAEDIAQEVAEAGGSKLAEWDQTPKEENDG
jgi:transcriptional regulator with XRE-family HTH domain